MAGVTSPICERFLQVAGGSGQGRGYQDWPRGGPGAPFWLLAPLLYRRPEWLCRGAPACWGGDPSMVPRGSGFLDAPGWGHMAALLPLRAGPTDALYPTGRCEVPPSVLSFCVCVGAPVRNGVHCSDRSVLKHRVIFLQCLVSLWLVWKDNMRFSLAPESQLIFISTQSVFGA